MLKTTLPFIVLRALEPEDLSLLYTIENDEELWEVSSTCTPISRYSLKQYLLQPQDVFQSGELRLVIEDTARKKTLGLVDLTGYSVLDRRAEVGIALLKEERGKGFGLAALQALDRYAKKNLQMRLLYAKVSMKHNPSSKSLFESAGYRMAALLPEWHFYQGSYEDVALFLKKI